VIRLIAGPAGLTKCLRGTAQVAPKAVALLFAIAFFAPRLGLAAWLIPTISIQKVGEFSPPGKSLLYRTRPGDYVVDRNLSIRFQNVGFPWAGAWGAEKENLCIPHQVLQKLVIGPGSFFFCASRMPSCKQPNCLLPSQKRLKLRPAGPRKTIRRRAGQADPAKRQSAFRRTWKRQNGLLMQQGAFRH